MNRWELTQGIITKSALKQAGGTLLPDVEYQYFVLGTEYKGNNVTIPPDIIEDVEVAQGLLAEYPVGKKVDVFYNPKVHRVAVLEKQAAVGVWWVLFITIGAAFISLLFGVALLLG